MSLLTGTIQTKEDRSVIIPYIGFHAVAFLLFFFVIGHLFYLGPGSLELDFAQKMLQGYVPYRDFPCEYPPLALLVFYLPALVTDAYPAYSLVFTVEILLLDMAVMVFIAALASHLGVSIRRALTVYTVLVIAVGPIIIARYDLLPAALTIAALWAFVRGKNLTAWTLLAFGVTAKLYPIIIAPVMGLYLLRNNQFLKIIKGGISFLATLLILNLPFVLLSPNGFLSSFTYHTKRGLQCESLYASIVLIGKAMGKLQVRGEFSYGSWNVSSPLADSFARISLYITAALLLLAYAHYAWMLWRKPRTTSVFQGLTPEETGAFIGYAALAIITFMIANKVFSPQYLIWLLPLLPLLKTRWSVIGWWIFFVAGIITQYIFPYKYMDYEYFKTPYVLLIAFRNVLVIVLAALIILASNTKERLKTELQAASVASDKQQSSFAK